MANRSDKNDGQKKTIYYDGSCPMCTTIIGKVGGSSQKEKFDPKDTARGSLPHGLTKEQVEKEIHVIGPDGKVYKNAEAILKILEEYPRWRFLVKIGGLPIIRQLLPVGYKFIAANRHFIFGPAGRIFWFKIIVVAGLISGLLLSVKLWAGPRFFPLVPVLDNLPAIPPVFGMGLFVLWLGLLTGILISPKPQKLIFGVLAIAAVLAFSDQMRWQPWFYHYFFMLAALGFFTWESSDTEKQRAILNTSRLIVASVYFFSGLQKMNPDFIGNIPRSIIFGPFLRLFSDSPPVFIFLFGVTIPILEGGIGLGLLTKKFRKPALVLALLMHAIIFLNLGPLGQNWNSIIWPWNVALIFLATALFWRADDFSLQDVIWVRSFPFQKLIFLLFAVMPVFSFFNLWDSYLSSTLYSRNTNTAQIYIENSLKERLPTEIQRYTARINGDRYMLDLLHWSLDELNVPPYPETRIYKGIVRNLCKYTVNSGDIVLVVNGKPTLFNQDRQSTYNCSDL